jgi:hypothetical protein
MFCMARKALPPIIPHSGVLSFLKVEELRIHRSLRYRRISKNQSKERQSIQERETVDKVRDPF